MDRNYETGKAEAESQASETFKQELTARQPVTRVDLDLGVARMLGHKNVEWDGARPYVKTEPLPNK